MKFLRGASQAHEPLTPPESPDTTSGKGYSAGTGPQLPKPKHVLYERERVVRGWGTPCREPICGYANEGNTCFMNAVLQALFHTPAFVNWLSMEEEHQVKCSLNRRSYQQCLLCALRTTLKESVATSHVMVPTQIFNKLKLVHKIFRRGRQEDAHEFLRYLLEGLNRDYLNAADAAGLDCLSKETTPVSQIFGGYLRTEVLCRKCGHVSTTFQHFAELHLDLLEFKSLQQALYHYFREERLDGSGYKCGKCSLLNQATKQFSLETAPNVLVIQLKRFTLRGRKINRVVECDQSLNLTQFQHSSASSPLALTYRLVGMVSHIGTTLRSGHYVTIAKTASGAFLKFDDASVEPVRHNVFLSPGAYIALYEFEGREHGPSEPVPESSVRLPAAGQAEVLSEIFGISSERQVGEEQFLLEKSAKGNTAVLPIRARKPVLRFLNSPVKPSRTLLLWTQVFTAPSAPKDTVSEQPNNRSGHLSLPAESSRREPASLTAYLTKSYPENKLMFDLEVSGSRQSFPEYLHLPDFTKSSDAEPKHKHNLVNPKTTMLALIRIFTAFHNPGRKRKPEGSQNDRPEKGCKKLCQVSDHNSGS